MSVLVVKNLFLKQVSFLFLVLISFSVKCQKIEDVKSVSVRASSFSKNKNLRVNRKYKEYVKYFRDNSSKFAVDEDKFSCWNPKDGKQIGEWIELHFEYPILPNSLKVLTGCHIDKFLFDLNKRVKKIEVSNEYGEKKKFTLKNTNLHNTFILSFKNPCKRIRITILKIENLTRNNKNSNVGFAEINVYHKTFNSNLIYKAINSGSLSEVRRTIKEPLKFVDNPNSIKTNTYNPIEYALLVGNEKIAKYLWKKEFRFYNASVKSLRDISRENEISQRIEKVKKAKQNFIQLKENLSNDSIIYNWEEIDEIKNTLPIKYEVIFEKEKVIIPKLIERKKTLYANIKLIEKKSEIDSISNSFIGLNELNYFKSENDLLFTHANAAIKEDLAQYILNKRIVILKALANQEKTAFLSKHLTINNIKDVNYYINYNSKKFKKYKDYTVVNNLFDFFKSYKSTLLSENYKLLFSEIIKMRRNNQLDEFTETFLSNTKKTSQVEALENLIKARRKVIEKVNKILKENWQKEKELRNIKINEYKSVVVSQRKTLERKYNVILPKIEDLHTALYYFKTLINSSGKYNKNDAYKFTNYIQGKGYIRNLKNNISDIEIFKNHKGYLINCASKKDDNGRFYHSVSLNVPNASKDLYNLYAKEIVSYYKNLEIGDYDPNKSPEGGLFYESGNTIYQIEYKSNKTLRVIAINNDDFEYDLPAERVGFNSFKIDSRPSFVYLYINKGDIIDFSVYGNMKLGFFAGYSSPSGINGYTIYNRVKGFKHGALLGKIGKNGNWFLIGKKTRMKAEETGTLYVTINDKQISDNDGHYTLTYNKY